MNELIVKIATWSLIAIILFFNMAIIKKILKEKKVNNQKEKILKENRDKIRNEEITNIVEKYSKIYNESEEKIKSMKKKMIIKGAFYSVLLIIGILMLIKYLFVDNHGIEEFSDFLGIFGISFIIICILSLMYNDYNKYNLLLKNVINNFITYNNPKLKYYRDIQVFKMDTLYTKDKTNEIIAECKDANFDDSPIDYSRISDYICGEFINGINIQIMDISFSKYNHKRTYMYCYFFGNLTILDKGIDNHIKIISKKINDLDMETPNSSYDFEKYFSIIVRDNENQENYISSDLKNFLLEFRNKYKIEFDIVLKDKIYIKFYTQNMFEAKVFGNPIDETSIYQYYAITKFAEKLIQILN